MTDIKYYILNKLYHSKLRTAKQKELYTGRAIEPLEIKNSIDDLVKAELIEKAIGSYSYHLTDKGVKVYEEEQESRRESAKEEKQQCTVNRINKGLLITSIVSSLIAVAEFFILLFR